MWSDPALEKRRVNSVLCSITVILCLVFFSRTTYTLSLRTHTGTAPALHHHTPLSIRTPWWLWGWDDAFVLFTQKCLVRMKVDMQMISTYQPIPGLEKCNKNCTHWMLWNRDSEILAFENVIIFIYITFWLLLALIIVAVRINMNTNVMAARVFYTLYNRRSIYISSSSSGFPFHSIDIDIVVDNCMHINI